MWAGSRPLSTNYSRRRRNPVFSLGTIGTATPTVAIALHTYEIDPTLAGSEVKLVCGNDTNWLLFDADYVLKLGPVEYVLTINIKEEAS